jgi:hypothetical protein
MPDGIVYKKLETDEEIAMAKELTLEYIQWLNIDLTFQNIDDELHYFPQKYKPPEGEFIIAKDNNTLDLYHKNGFYEIAPYYANPNAGVVCLEKAL